MTTESTNSHRKRGRPARPFDAVAAAHTLVQTAEQLGYDFSDSEAFLKRAQHIEFGLSAEVELAALLRWLGWCPLVHRLGEDILSENDTASWKVPDLFAVFENAGARCGVLIEVKTSKDLRLVFKTEYLEKLRAYSDFIQKPLLIAWKPRVIGFWVLFDPKCAVPFGADRLEIDLEVALKNDLMSALAGDFYLVPTQGAGVVFEMVRTGEKKPVADGYQAMFQVKAAYTQDAAGNKTTGISSAIWWALISVEEGQQKIGDDSIILSFVASGAMTRAQCVLRAAAAFPLSDAERIHWKSVGRNFDEVLTCNNLLTEAQKCFGTFMSYIFHQRPAETPSFLPDEWPGLNPRT